MRKIITITLNILYMFASNSSTGLGFSVKEKGKNLVVNSPYGEKVLLGEYGFTKYHHYKINMSVEEFRKLFIKEEFNVGKIENEPENPAFKVETTEELLYLANQAYHASNVKNALYFVNEVLRRDQKNERAWIMKGSLMHLLNEKEMAIKYWTRALEINPENLQLKKMMSLE